MCCIAKNILQEHARQHKNQELSYLHVRHIHDAPPHIRAFPHVAAEHIRDCNFREINVGDTSKAGVVKQLREAGVSATRNENLGRRGFGEGSKVGNEWVFELRPLGIPLKSIAMAAYGEEIVPILFAGEVAESLEDVVGFRHGRAFLDLLPVLYCAYGERISEGFGRD